MTKVVDARQENDLINIFSFIVFKPDNIIVRNFVVICMTGLSSV